MMEKWYSAGSDGVERVQQVRGMRKFLIFAGALALAACDGDLTSETPVIPTQDLSAPRALKGAYWVLDVEDGKLGAWQTKWRWQKDRRAVLDGWEGKANLRLVKLTDSGVHLVIIDDEKNVSAYFLMHRSEGGIFEWDHIDVPSNLFTYEVAARHGFAFSDSGNEIIAKGETFPGEAIPQLFQDQDFLGTLTFAPQNYFLPMSPKGDRAEHSIPLPVEEEAGFPIELAESGVPSAETMVQPASLAGPYVVNRSDDVLIPSYEVADGELAELREMPDGSFELWQSADFTDKPKALARISVEKGARLADVFELRQAADGPERLAWRDDSWRAKGVKPGPFDFLLDGKLYLIDVPDDGPVTLTDVTTKESRSPDTEELKRILSRGVVNSFLGIYEPPERVDEAPPEAGEDGSSTGDEGLGKRKIFSLQRRFNGCWSLSGWQEKPTSAPPELEAMRARLMDDAADRNGLSYSAGTISGAHSLAEATELLSEPRFNHGIEGEDLFELCARPQG
jgi:hypothetical protein